MMHRKSTLEELSWEEAKPSVYKVNEPLAAAIDHVSPNSSYKLYRVRYPYGAMIFDKGVLNLPNSAGELVPINHHSIPSALKEQLTYRVTPMFLVLKKSIEVYAELGDYIIPLNVFPEGTISGVWETFDPMQSYFIQMIWNASSGARSMFMLPKISEVSGYKRLQKDFGIRINPAKHIRDHWHIFKEIANSSCFTTPWFSEVLFFSKQWFDELQKDNSWLELQRYLYSTAWQQSMFYRFAITFNIVWQKFATLVKYRGIHCGSYQLETLKHLIILMVGALPAFRASDPKEIAAPTQALQDAFLHSYDIDYAPTIMFPHNLSRLEKNSIGYYSISEPTLIESVPKTREVSNLMQVTREIKILYEHFRNEVKNGSLSMGNMPIYELIQKAEIDFFHSAFDESGLLTLSSHLTKNDCSFLEISSKHKNLPFCYSSKFLRSGIRISL